MVPRGRAVGESSFPIGRPVGRPTESPIATLMKLTLAGVLAFAAAAHAAQPAGLSEGWGMKLFVVVLLALVAAVSGFGSPPKDREAEAVREPRARTSYAASLGRAPSMPRTGWQPTSEGGTDPSDCVSRSPPQPMQAHPARPRLNAACPTALRADTLPRRPAAGAAPWTTRTGTRSSSGTTRRRTRRATTGAP